MITIKDKLTSAETGKLWTVYMGNSLFLQVLRFNLHHCEDEEIKQLVKESINYCSKFDKAIQSFFQQENFPMPQGFTEKDLKVDAPKLFADEFLLFYLKYVNKAALSLYSTALPLMTRKDVREFITDCLQSSIKLINQVNEVLINRKLFVKPPFIPTPDKIDFIKKQNYLNGFFGKIRPLQALEITHLYDNIENNLTSKAILVAFSQVAQLKQTRDYFIRGEKMMAKHCDILSQVLEKNRLPAPSLLDQYVSTSTESPFSDKLMIFHKLDMFSMRIRTYSNAISFSPRHDLAAMYTRLLTETGNYSEDGANILIDMGWMEQPPQAVDRHQLAIQKDGELVTKDNL